MWALVAVCVLVVFFLYGKMSEGFKGGGKSSVLTLIPGVFLITLVMAAIRIFVSTDLLWQIVAALIVVFAVILPITTVVEKTTYQSAVLVWVVCALALAMILAMEKPLVSAFQRGIEKGSLVKERKNFYESLDK
jgi:energy-coupling factor transporter transmembrane protein EcfT